MNERIVELIKQSGTDVSGKWMSMYQVEKFAELIVRECASKVDWILAGVDKTQGDLIKEHFGVEE
jgi:hypothetical protein